jgi:hypothetical protein
MLMPHVPKQRSSTSRIHCSKVIVDLILSEESSFRVRRVIQLKGIAFDHDGKWGDQEVAIRVSNGTDGGNDRAIGDPPDLDQGGVTRLECAS